MKIVRPSRPSTVSDLDIRIAMLVDDAARIVYTADRVVKKLSEDNPDSLNKIIEDHYETVCGLFTPTWTESRDERPAKNAFFWKCLTIGIADQFRGFTVRNKKEDADYLIEQTFTKGTGRDGKFWGLLENSEFARPWFLVSFQAALDRTYREEAIRFDEFDRLLEVKAKANTSESHFAFTRLAAIERLINKARTGHGGGSRFPAEKLLEVLERKLTRGSDVASALEISLLMRTLVLLCYKKTI